jgi:hypothetical protein
VVVEVVDITCLVVIGKGYRLGVELKTSELKPMEELNKFTKVLIQLEAELEEGDSLEAHMYTSYCYYPCLPN